MKKLLVGVLALASVSSFANCNIKVEMDESFKDTNNFEYYKGVSPAPLMTYVTDEESEAMFPGFYKRKKRKVSERMASLPTKIDKMLSKRGYESVETESEASYLLSLKPHLFMVEYVFTNLETGVELEGDAYLTNEYDFVAYHTSMKGLKKMIKKLQKCRL